MWFCVAKCVEGPKDVLDSTVVSQPAIFVSSMAAVEKLRSSSPEAVDSCTVAMGLSLGEYSALCFAGAFSFADGVRLTKARGEAMQAASDLSPSGMLAVAGADVDKVRLLCQAAEEKSGKHITIGNYLSDGNYAVSGAKEACEALSSLARSHGIRMVVPLAVAGAFHTVFMEPAVEPLKKALAATTIFSPRIPVVANVDGKAHFEPSDIRATLLQQVSNPVRWDVSMKQLLTSPDFKKAYELGPGTVCAGIVKRYGKQYEVVNVTV